MVWMGHTAMQEKKSTKKGKCHFHGNSCFEIFNYKKTIYLLEKSGELHCPAGDKNVNKQLKNAAFLWQLLLPCKLIRDTIHTQLSIYYCI
jgi:hypothetical protein